MQVVKLDGSALMSIDLLDTHEAPELEWLLSHLLDCPNLTAIAYDEERGALAIDSATWNVVDGLHVTCAGQTFRIDLTARRID